MISDIAKLTYYKILSAHQKWIYGKKKSLFSLKTNEVWFLFICLLGLKPPDLIFKLFSESRRVTLFPKEYRERSVQSFIKAPGAQTLGFQVIMARAALTVSNALEFLKNIKIF